MNFEAKKISFAQKYPAAKDILSFLSFAAAVAFGVFVLNNFVFRSYNVVGGSMENTLHSHDRVIVNRLPVTWAHFWGEDYIPKRGQIVVFANGGNGELKSCEAITGIADQYIIKRVIAFPGERVQVKDGKITVYNDQHPEGFNPDDTTRKGPEDGPKENTSGSLDIIVPEGELFVAGDNREGSNSLDSRSGLGTIPFCRFIGPASIRILPLNKIRLF